MCSIKQSKSGWESHYWDMNMTKNYVKLWLMIKSLRLVNLCLLLSYCLDNEYCDIIIGDGHGQGNSWLTYCWDNSEWLWFTVINDGDGQWNNVRFTLCHKPSPSLRFFGIGYTLSKGKTQNDRQMSMRWFSIGFTTL